MRATREQVIQALQARLETVRFSQPVSGATTWKSVSRKLKLFSDVPPQQRPALFITDHHESSVNRSENTPQLSTMSLNLFIYTNAKAATIPAVDLNVILEALDAVLEPTPAENGKQTLGGLVSHCRTEGETLKDPGDIDGDGFLWVPIKIFGP